MSLLAIVEAWKWEQGHFIYPDVSSYSYFFCPDLRSVSAFIVTCFSLIIDFCCFGLRTLEHQLKEIRLAEEDGSGMLSGQKASRAAKWIIRSDRTKKADTDQKLQIFFLRVSCYFIFLGACVYKMTMGCVFWWRHLENDSKFILYSIAFLSPTKDWQSGPAPSWLWRRARCGAGVDTFSKHQEAKALHLALVLYGFCEGSVVWIL